MISGTLLPQISPEFSQMEGTNQIQFLKQLIFWIKPAAGGHLTCADRKSLFDN
jgi:hypothetical protein